MWGHLVDKLLKTKRAKRMMHTTHARTNVVRNRIDDSKEKHGHTWAAIWKDGWANSAYFVLS